MSNSNQIIDVRAPEPGARRLLAFIGPAVLVSVGYMDPGNWATDLEGGARFGYQLLWVLLASNLVAILVQSLSVRLGIISGRDLAQACRQHYPRPTVYALWLLAEVAIIACDLAEVLGSTIALNLLFSIPMLWGVLITGLDVLLILGLQHYGVRMLEAVIAVMVLTVGVCFGVEIALAQPHWHRVAGGFVPRMDSSSLYIAIGILGATVMPHNLYLHSALVQTRRIGSSVAAKREAIRYNFIDTMLALNIAFVINVAIMVLSAAVFFERGIEVTDLRQAYQLLSPLLGTALASAAFAVALLAAGQSSTITGTLAGQVVMEGFLRIRLTPVARRLLTRWLAIVPAIAVLAAYGERGVLPLLIASQVVLSLQLPFAIVPLIRFTSSKKLLGDYATPAWLSLLAWLSAGCIIALNVWLIASSVSDFRAQSAAFASASAWLIAVALACGVLLAWISIAPLTRGEPFECDKPDRGVQSGADW
jgi:manganese transport protein